MWNIVLGMFYLFIIALCGGLLLGYELGFVQPFSNGTLTGMVLAIAAIAAINALDHVNDRMEKSR